MKKYIIHLHTDRTSEELEALRAGLMLWGAVTFRESFRDVENEQTIKTRNVEMRQLYEEDPKTNSVGKLGVRYGLSRERICQILRKTNTISTSHERRAAAKEALVSEITATKVEAKRLWQEKLDAALEKVKAGESIRQATLSSGLQGYSNFAQELSKLAKLQGVQTKYGRWRDFSKRKARIIELRDKGMQWADVLATMRAEGDPVYYNWVIDNMPELVRRKGVNPNNS